MVHLDLDTAWFQPDRTFQGSFQLAHRLPLLTERRKERRNSRNLEKKKLLPAIYDCEEARHRHHHHRRQHPSKDDLQVEVDHILTDTDMFSLVKFYILCTRLYTAYCCWTLVYVGPLILIPHPPKV